MNNGTIYSAATISLIIFDALITVVSTVLHLPSIFNLIGGLKTLVCLLFVYWHQNVDVLRINKIRFFTSLLLLLHILAIIISRIFSAQVSSYTLGLGPPVLLASWFYSKRVHHKTVQATTVNPLEVQIEDKLAPKKFDTKELMAITNNFNNIVVTSSYVTTFRGILPNGQQIYVARLNTPKDQGNNSAFVIGFSNLTNSRHENFMELLGYCFTPNFHYFVLEYMANHRVYDWIFSKDTNRRRTLAIAQRYQVAVDVAKALDYLNNHRKNFHFNVNSRSVFLDENFRAKVLNSNSWRFLGQFKYPVDDDMSLKYNFYRYGSLLLELITGQKHQPWDEHCKLKNGKALELVDQDLEIYEEDEPKLERLLNVALFCVHQILENRPTIAQVAAMLEGHDHIPSVKDTPLEIMMPKFEVTYSSEYYGSSSSVDDYFVLSWP